MSAKRFPLTQHAGSVGTALLWEHQLLATPVPG
jgi:hypothetical protein